MTNSQLYTTNWRQEVNLFPAGDHKSQINRRPEGHNKHKKKKNIKNTFLIQPTECYEGTFGHNCSSCKAIIHLSLLQVLTVLLVTENCLTFSNCRVKLSL